MTNSLLIEKFSDLYREISGEPLGAHVREQLTRRSSRVVITGRFKAGKSSVLNALVGEQLLPVDVLPATGTVVELRRDVEFDYARDEGDGWQESDQVTFEHESTVANEKAANSRWRLRAANVPDGIVYVDTPGVDENEARRVVAAEAVEEADLVLLVTRATQPLGIEEKEWAEPYEKAERLLVAVSAVDQLDDDASARLDEYLTERLDAPIVKVAVPSLDQAQGIEELQQRISELANAARVRAVEQVLGDALDEIDDTADAADVEAALQEIRSLQSSHGSRRKNVLSAVEESQGRTRKKARRRAKKAWPAIVRQILQTKDNWSSEKNPITSPKLFAEDIGERVKGVAKHRVRTFVRDEIEPLVSNEMQKLETKVGEINRDIRDASWFDSPLKTGSLSSAAIEKQLSAKEIGGGDVGVQVGVAAAVSAALGYIIADIVLFYILGIISGFLNPVLLAAAAVVGLAIFVTGGKSALQSKARDKIADKIGTELRKDETNREVANATAQAVDDAFSAVEDAYAEALRELADSLRQRESELLQAQKEQKSRFREKLKTLQELAGQIVASVA